MISMRLGVNVDHVATLRQARGTTYPDPVKMALLAEKAGADQITVHLREDRRHIQEEDVYHLRQKLQVELNLEMAATEEMLNIALSIHPDIVTFVPEKREELTTEGGLDVVNQKQVLAPMISNLQKKGIRISMFIDPEDIQIEASAALKINAVEFHTGQYAEATTAKEAEEYRAKIVWAVQKAKQEDLFIAAGHGLHYENVERIVAIKAIQELNIGHAIIARAMETGIESAVREMRKLLK